MGIIGILVAAPVLTLMKTPEEVLPLSTLYMRIYFPGHAGDDDLQLRQRGTARQGRDTKRPLNYLTIAGVINASY